MATNLDITFKADQDDDRIFDEFFIRENNALDVKTKRLMHNPIQVHVNINGSGIAYTSVSYEYMRGINDTKTKNGKFYALNIGTHVTDDDKVITITVGTHSLKERGIRGMSLVEVKLPSGFQFQNEEQMYRDLVSKGVKVRQHDYMIDLIITFLIFNI